MRIFWARGYDQSPIDVLCRGMGMPRASLYQSYGDKEGLFLAAVAHYAATRLKPVIAALGPAGSLHEDLTQFFHQVVQLAAADSETPGCLISSVLANAAAGNAAFQAERDRRFEALETRISLRLAADGWPDEGSCSASVAASLAAAMARGLVSRARSGQCAEQLHPVGIAAADALIALRERGLTAGTGQ